MYNLIEQLVWGKKSKTSKQYLVLNERAWDRLAGKLFSELPRDEAITVLNAIKQYAK